MLCAHERHHPPPAAAPPSQGAWRWCVVPAARRYPRRVTVRLAVVLLVDDRGWVLLQERDSEAPRAPDQWGMPGGHVEEGEQFEEAAYRELQEETGVVLEPGHLYLWRDEELPYDVAEGTLGRYHVYVARVDALTDADIVCGEGRQIVFVDPAVVPTLDLSQSTAYFVPQFLDSSTYRRLSGIRPPGEQ
jgi:8-oxo-dGTP diphosphatase